MFRNGTIGSHRTCNRIVRSATNDHLANRDGSISDAQVKLVQTLAENRVGVIITGHLAVDERYRASGNQLLISEDRFIPGLTKLAEAAHSSNALIYGQISHGGLNAENNPFDINTVSAEAIEEAVSRFAEAAVRLERSGFDGVQLHLAHGYLLANVLDPTINHRTDSYGGNDENRVRLVRDIILAIREKCTAEFDILVKLNANSRELTPYDSTLKYYVRELETAGVDAIEVSGVNFAKFDRDQGNYFLREALLIKETVRIPVILVGGVAERKYMEEAMAAGIDFVSFARAFVCEPEFVTNLMNGSDKPRCVKCWQCLRLFRSKYKNCVFLPEDPQLRTIFADD